MEELTEKEYERLRELLEKHLGYLKENEPDAFSSIAAVEQVLSEA